MNNWNSFLYNAPRMMQTDILGESSAHQGLLDYSELALIEDVPELPALKALRDSSGIEMLSTAETIVINERKRRQAQSSVMEFLESQAPTVVSVAAAPPPVVDEVSDRRSRRRSSIATAIRRMSSLGIPTTTDQTGTESARRSSRVGSHLRRRSSTQLQHVVEPERNDPVEDEEMLMRLALGDSEAAFEEDIRRREAKAKAESEVDALIQEENERILQAFAETGRRRSSLRLEAEAMSKR